MTKKQLRSIYKKKRSEISLQQIEKYNDLILNNFQKINLEFINCIHTYLPSLRLVEPDTANIIRYLQFKNPSLKIVVPKIDIHSGNMHHFQFDETVELLTNEYGVDEPVSGNKISETEIDLVLVPLLAFDKTGFRVGYGKGYYDKFISLCRKDAIKVGLSYFDPVDQIEDLNQFDISLNYCVTPAQLFTF